MLDFANIFYWYFSLSFFCLIDYANVFNVERDVCLCAAKSDHFIAFGF